LDKLEGFKDCVGGEYHSFAAFTNSCELVIDSLSIFIFGVVRRSLFGLLGFRCGCFRLNSSSVLLFKGVWILQQS
jgi:hypothetical protein